MKNTFRSASILAFIGFFFYMTSPGLFSSPVMAGKCLSPKTGFDKPANPSPDPSPEAVSAYQADISVEGNLEEHASSTPFQLRINDPIRHILELSRQLSATVDGKKVGLQIGFAGSVARRMLTGKPPLMPFSDLDMTVHFTGIELNRAHKAADYVPAELQNLVTQFAEQTTAYLKKTGFSPSIDFLNYTLGSDTISRGIFGGTLYIRSCVLDRFVVLNKDGRWMVVAPETGQADIKNKILRPEPKEPHLRHHALNHDSVIRFIRLVMEYPDWEIDPEYLDLISEFLADNNNILSMNLEQLTKEFPPSFSFKIIVKLFLNAQDPKTVILLLMRYGEIKPQGGTRTTVYSFFEQFVDFQRLQEILDQGVDAGVEWSRFDSVFRWKIDPGSLEEWILQNANDDQAYNEKIREELRKIIPEEGADILLRFIDNEVDLSKLSEHVSGLFVLDRFKVVSLCLEVCKNLFEQPSTVIFRPNDMFSREFQDFLSRNEERIRKDFREGRMISFADLYASYLEQQGLEGARPEKPGESGSSA
ncbi:MAG: hypothetical protein JW774_06735 [Candidatus Aureabacteria bacterium]|nr:hypothetical protein [Candidatus Auribacterota bacterium]